MNATQLDSFQLHERIGYLAGAPLMKSRLGRDRDELALVTPRQSPPLFVDAVVMPPAQEHEVGELIRTAVRPMFEVMAVCPRRRTITTFKPAAFVARHQRSLSRRMYSSTRATGIDLM